MSSNTVELKSLEQSWDYENWFELQVVQSSKAKFLYKQTSRDSSPIYGTSAVRVFVLFFSFSIFSDRRLLN